jgi:hypothetical protein
MNCCGHDCTPWPSRCWIIAPQSAGGGSSAGKRAQAGELWRGAMLSLSILPRSVIGILLAPSLKQRNVKKLPFARPEVVDDEARAKHITTYPRITSLF